MTGETLPDSKHGRATNRGQCRSCKEPVLWVRTFKNDKPLLVDPGTDKAHFADCPDADRWRKGRS